MSRDEGRDGSRLYLLLQRALDTIVMHGERLDVVPAAVTAQAFGFAPPYLRSRSA